MKITDTQKRLLMVGTLGLFTGYILGVIHERNSQSQKMFEKIMDRVDGPFKGFPKP